MSSNALVFSAAWSEPSGLGLALHDLFPETRASPDGLGGILHESRMMFGKSAKKKARALRGDDLPDMSAAATKGVQTIGHF